MVQLQSDVIAAVMVHGVQHLSGVPNVAALKEFWDT